jgi:hypothetical protein
MMNIARIHDNDVHGRPSFVIFLSCLVIVLIATASLCSAWLTHPQQTWMLLSCMRGAC